MGIIITILVGALAGYLAGLIWKGGGFGFLMNLVIGIAGAFIGKFVFWIAGFRAEGIIAYIISAVVGALIILWIMNKIKK